MSKKIVLFTLQTFSSTGGIQKMTRTLAHSLATIAEHKNWKFELWSAYDNEDDLMDKYLPASKFKGFNANKIRFALKALSSSLMPDVIILSHVNLSLIGLLVKLLNPKCSVWLIAHGIEVWRPLSIFQNKLLNKCDKVICVSQYTRDQVIKRHKIDFNVCHVLNNAVDPFMDLPVTYEKPQYLVERYGLQDSQPVIFTLTRLASTEQYKGYEQVIKAVSDLKKRYPNIKYILSGKYDDKEESRIRKIIDYHDVAPNVILTGFIDENELSGHFLLADLFVLPSKKEGFGIVFIEALACGLPVICGNADGSVDAIRHGELGASVNADDAVELTRCIINYLDTPLTALKRKLLQNNCLRHFNEDDYINKIKALLNE
jgi:phosphatidylinositol alpha-1,6-mannosyltransferase